MAQLKDTIITGDASITGTVYPSKIQGNTIWVPTASGGSTYGAGTAGQLLSTNGTNVYWGDVATASTLSIDSTPTQNSTNLVTSGGVYAMIGDVESVLTTLLEGTT